MTSKYDEYGRLKSEPWPEIKKGDRVGFTTTIMLTKKQKIKVKYISYWDGEKVTFKNNDNTIVRTTRWLTNENIF